MEKRGRFSLAAADDIDDDAVAVAVAMVVVAKKRRNSPDRQSSLREERKGEEEGEETFLRKHAHAFLKCALLKRLKTSVRFVIITQQKIFSNTLLRHTSPNNISSSITMFASTTRVLTTESRVHPTRRWKSNNATRVAKIKASSSNLEGAESVQLGTAKLPADINVETFSSSLFQWATTLTTSGQNMPFVLPQKIDKTETGFEMDFLKSNPNDPGSFVSVGTIEAKVEEIDDGSKILFLRGYGDVRVPKKLVDVPIVMQTMPNAIKRAITVSMP